MGVKYVKVEGRRSECPCSVGTEKGILWEYVDDNYRHFQTLCGPCAEDLFGEINMFKLPVLTPEQITEIRPKSQEEEGYCEVSPDLVDLIANLSAEVTQLKRSHAEQIDTLFRNVQQLGEELATMQHVEYVDSTPVTLPKWMIDRLMGGYRG